MAFSSSVREAGCQGCLHPLHLSLAELYRITLSAGFSFGE